MAMTKKDFIALADAIRSFNADHIKRAHYNESPRFSDDQIACLATFYKSQNYNFMPQRWLGYIAGENGQNGGKVASR